jgi:aminoglycoside phosphotransferase family enzyme/predicted kinase
VFLAGDRAYKIKRSVRFPFLDYSTLSRRKAACEAELAVNRPFAPQIYLGVTPITRANGQLALGGGGDPVEWAVVMRRFDEDATLDRLAEREGITLGIADQLARVAAAAHAKAPIASANPWLDALSRFVDQNQAACGETPELFPSAKVEALTRASHQQLERLRPLLLSRGNQGLVRRGHGDLHLGNIALIDGKPVPFDAIEFDPLVATGDVLYDLAFLLMDLVERGLQHAANLVLNRYLLETRRDSDLDALAALPLFMSLRAAIRAKVTAARLENANSHGRSDLALAAKKYFDLARELIAPPSPALVAVGGLSGTGKSVLARRLAPDIPPAPGAVLLRSDVERKALFGTGETEPLPSSAYTVEANAKVYESLCTKAGRTVAAGHSAVVDAVFAQEAERAAIEKVAASKAIILRGLFLTTRLETRIERIASRRGDASDADANIARQQETYRLGPLRWVQLDASGAPDVTLNRARASLAGEDDRVSEV